MWHEARRQERKIRGMLVDYRRRAERRRDFYEKIKADPTQFLQLHGRPCKIHLDSAIASAADSPAAMMPWQGQADNLIDRFDVRAHLDYIPTVAPRDSEEESYEERQCNYERYRILAQNTFLVVNEEKFLKQLHLEEQFGYTAENEKEKKKKQGAAIGFNYDEPGKDNIMKSEKGSSDSDDSDSDLDVDLCIDVSKIEQSQAHEMNRCGQQFGMCSNDFYSFLINDMEEAENIRIAREEEHEKALYSGRKSRRERRAHRERRLANRIPSPPSYAARSSPVYPTLRESKSVSKSPSPDINPGQITYITSFGGEEEPSPSTSKPTYADKVKFGKKETKNDDKKLKKRYRNGSRSRSRSINRYRRRSKSYSRSPQRYRHRRTKSRSSSRSSHHRRRSRSSSRSLRRRRPSNHHRTRRSRSRNRKRYARSSRSRSRDRRKYRSPSSRSRSRSSSSVSSSSVSSKSVSKSKSRSKSRSKSVESPVSRESEKKAESPKPIQRYYGRRQEDKSSSELSGDSDEEDKPPASGPVTNDKPSMFGNSVPASKNFVPAPIIKMTPQERLKRKMQLLLNKQYKADKIAEQLRTERAQQEQRNREDELREMALKLRRKQRERRHAYDDNSRSSDSDATDDSTRLEKAERELRERNRERSVTPSSPASRRRPREDDDARKERSPKRIKVDDRNRDREKKDEKERRDDRKDDRDRKEDRDRKDERSYKSYRSRSSSPERKRDKYDNKRERVEDRRRDDSRYKSKLVDY